MVSADKENRHASAVSTEDAMATRASPATPPERTDNGYSYGSFPVYDTAIEPLPSATSGSATNGTEANGQAKPAAATKPSTRALAPDLLRGLLMVIMAMDHMAIALHTWEHGTGRGNEGDGVVVRRWNFPAAYVVRTLTHLCGGGFTFLLGMGVVYLTRSRTAMGWSASRLVRYFALRALVLTLVTALFGVVVTAGKIWFMNAVMFSLAVDYFLAGVLYLIMMKTERLLAVWLARIMPTESLDDDDADQPLLSDRVSRSGAAKTSKAESLSWHIHNGLLLVLSIVTICWNIWLSENHGYCRDTASTDNLSVMSDNVWRDIWFWPVQTEHVMSVFPPMAWLSFAVVGLLYGRIIVARPWSRRAMGVGTMFAASLFMLVFVLTRLLRFGNLSEGCLETPEHDAHPDANPYLVSVASFMYVVKYPPDVAFWAFTLAGNLFLLAGFGAIPTAISKRFTMLLDFGTSALFFYIVHMFVVFGLGIGSVALFGHDTGVTDPMDPSNSMGIDNLFGYFGLWALAMLILWPICRWYSRFKSTKSANSIWRFF